MREGYFGHIVTTNTKDTSNDANRFEVNTHEHVFVCIMHAYLMTHFSIVYTVLSPLDSCEEKSLSSVLTAKLFFQQRNVCIFVGGRISND